MGAPMSPRSDDGVLENGEYWEGVKADADLPYHIRAKAYWAYLSRSSFLSRRGSSGPRKPLRRTAYLDGLRGFAAFVVYWHHHQLWARESIHADVYFERGFGYEGHYYFAALPFVRIFVTGGHFAVTVFFIISGYVLSVKPLSLVHSREYLKLSDNLGSALFRRWPRLFIPVIATTFCYMLSWYLFGIWVADTDIADTFRAELWTFYCDWKNYSFLFNAKVWLKYNLHIWSIPVEFQGTIVIYTSLLAFSRATRNMRLWCEAGLVFYFLYITDAAYFAMFSVGMLLADLDLLAESNNLPGIFYRLESFKELIFYHFLVLGMYLGGVPSHNSDISEIKSVRGWYYLSFLKPQAVYDYKWFYLFWAGTMVVSSIPRIPWLKRFFETPFNQYLGRISFSFYLVHGPVLRILADRLYSATGWVRDTHPEHIPAWIEKFPLSKAGPLGFELSFWAPHLIVLPVTLWLAQVVKRLFDEPSVKFAQWLYGKTLEPPPIKS